MNTYRVPRTWRLPEDALRRSLAEMALDGRADREGVAMWLGRHDDNGDVGVTHVVFLRGSGLVKRFDLLQISADLMNEISDLALEAGVMLVGQIHAHAPGYGVDLSIADRTLGVVVPGYLSAVAPDFALNPATRVGDIGFHLFENGRWRRFGGSEITSRIILTNATVAVLTAGVDQ